MMQTARQFFFLSGSVVYLLGCGRYISCTITKVLPKVSRSFHV